MKTSGRRSWACLFRATRIELVAEVPTPGFAFDIASVSVQTDAAVSFSSFIGDNTQEALSAAIRALSPRDRARLDGAYRLAVDDPAPVGARVFREEQQVAFLPDDDGEPTALEEFFQEKEASVNAPPAPTALPFSSASSSSTGLPRRRRSKRRRRPCRSRCLRRGTPLKGPRWCTRTGRLPFWGDAHAKPPVKKALAVRKAPYRFDDMGRVIEQPPPPVEKAQPAKADPTPAPQSAADALGANSSGKATASSGDAPRGPGPSPEHLRRQAFIRREQATRSLGGGQPFAARPQAPGHN